MNRGMPGRPIVFDYSGSDVISLVPWPLPPNPSIRWTTSLNRAFDKAMLALGRLDAGNELLSSAPPALPDWLTRREAVMGLTASGARQRLSFTESLMHEARHADRRTSPDTLLAAQNAVAAVRLGHARTANGSAPTSDLLKQIQRVLTGEAKRRRYGGSTHLGVPGEFRHTYIWTDMLNRTNRPNLRSPPDQVPETMQALDDFVSGSQPSKPALLKTALAHAQFDLIYPFGDDCLRVNLIYAGLLLRANGLINGPVLQLSDSIALDRPAYTDAIDKVLQYGNWEDYLHYFAGLVTAAAERTAGLMKQVTELVQAHMESVKELGRAANSARMVLGSLTDTPVGTPSELQERTGLSAKPVNTALRHLQRMGIVSELTGYKRYRLFLYEPLTDLLSEGTDRIVWGPRRAPRTLGGTAWNLRAHRP